MIDAFFQALSVGPDIFVDELVTGMIVLTFILVAMFGFGSTEG